MSDGLGEEVDENEKKERFKSLPNKNLIWDFMRKCKRYQVPKKVKSEGEKVPFFCIFCQMRQQKCLKDFSFLQSGSNLGILVSGDWSLLNR